MNMLAAVRRVAVAVAVVYATWVGMLATHELGHCLHAIDYHIAQRLLYQVGIYVDGQLLIRQFARQDYAMPFGLWRGEDSNVFNDAAEIGLDKAQFNWAGEIN